MASGLFPTLRKASSLFNPLSSSYLNPHSIRPILEAQESVLYKSRHLLPLSPQGPLLVFRSLSYGGLNLVLLRGKHKFETHEVRPLVPLSLQNPSCVFRYLSYGRVNLVMSEGKPKFETHEVDPPKKQMFQTKKRFKMRKKREKEKRKAANKRDPRRLTVKGSKKKKKFVNAEERIKYKLEKARIKEALLLERLKRYEVPKVHGPEVKPHDLTGEERFFMKKMAQKSSNYVPVGRRGIFGGVILNMHMHWKKHETVKVICNFCKPGQVHQYAQEIARLSGGIPIQKIGDDTIVFYRGKNYVQPEVMSPIDTLSKKRALEKSKYEQSLESVRRFIAIAEKELELYYRHIALYGDPQNRNPLAILESPQEISEEPEKTDSEDSTVIICPMEGGPPFHESSETQDSSDIEDTSTSASDSEDKYESFPDELPQDDFERQ